MHNVLNRVTIEELTLTRTKFRKTSNDTFFINCAFFRWIILFLNDPSHKNITFSNGKSEEH